MKNKIIKTEEIHPLLLNMLSYIDKVCRENDIKYSLIGGTLLGAIRHNGFIPWDDDIDIILDYNNYKKLINILKNKKDDKYEVLIPGESHGYPLQFAKLIDKRNILKADK